MAPTDDAFRALVDTIDVPTWVVRADDVLHHANPAATAALGHPPGALVGQRCHELAHRGHDGGPILAEECLPCRSRAAAAADHGQGAWFLRRDGSVFPVAWRSWPLELPGGVGAVVRFSEIPLALPSGAGPQDPVHAAVPYQDVRAAQRRLAQDELELRRQLSHDLHDGAQQHLVMVLILLRLLRQELGAPTAGTAQLLDEMTELTELAVAGLRDVLARVHPSVLATRGLVAAVQALAEDAPVPVEVTGPPDRRFDVTAEAHSYVFVLQALARALENAHPSRVTVTIGETEGRLTVEVYDDGVPDGVPDAGARRSEDDLLSRIGLRVRALEGTFTAVPVPGRGTTLRATFAPHPDPG